MKFQHKEVKAFLIIWAVFLFVILVCLSAFTISKIINDRKITQAQIEQIGKPFEYNYNQYYHTVK